MASRTDTTIYSSDTRTPEYCTFQEYFPILIDALKADVDDLCDALFGKSYISPDVRDYIRTPGITNKDKARKLFDAVIDRIEQNPTVFHDFVNILRSPHNDELASTLQLCYESKCATSKPEENSDDSSSDELLHFYESKCHLLKPKESGNDTSGDPFSDANSVYCTPALSVKSLKVNAILNEVIENQDKEGVADVLTHLNRWNIDLRVWYLRGRQKLSFLEECLRQFQAQIEKAPVISTHGQSNTSQKGKLSFKQLFHFKLSPHFIVEPRTFFKIENEPRLLPSNYTESQSVHYENFSSYFQKLLDQKYSHLNELYLIGDNYRPGRITDDLECDLRTCNKLEHYERFFALRFGEYRGINELQKYFKQWYVLCSHTQFQLEILSQVSSFCYFLIASRKQTIEVLEQCEKDLHNEVCLYSIFKSIVKPTVSGMLSDIAKKFKEKVGLIKKRGESPSQEASSIEASHQHHALLDIIESLVAIHHSYGVDSTRVAHDERERIVKLEIELYLTVLKVLDINQKATEQARQCLLNSGTNHFAYLHQHLSNLYELLKIVLHPYTVSHERKDTHTIYTVMMVVGSVSGALSAFSEWLAINYGVHSLNEGDQLRLCADTALFLDSDIEHDHLSFHGVSVALISPRLSHEKRGKVYINTDGKPLNSVYPVADASSGGDGTKDDKEGQPGKDGDDGLYGNAGGHILIVGNTLYPNNFKLSAKASRGQDGQHGGDGGDGWSPPKEFEGKDGSEPEFEPGRLRTEDSVVIQYGTYGQDGGQGGDAGMGGAAGKSGISGKIELIDLANEANCTVNQEAIEDGASGKPGKPGKGGKHARHGRDWGKYAAALHIGQKLTTFFTATRPDYSITSVKGELEHPKIEKKPGSGKKFEKKGAKGLPRQRKKEDHPDFKDRGSNRNGKAAQVKGNTAFATDNKAIDKNACFMAMKDQCGKTINHWNEKSHHDFLKSLASKIDTSYEGRYMTLTRSERIKTGQDKWIDYIRKLSGKTEVAVAYSREQTQRARVQVMKNFEPETPLPLSISPLSSKKNTDDEDLCIHMSEFNDNAEEKEIVCNDLPLESILTSDEHDNHMEYFLSQLGLSGSYIHIVVVAGSEKAKELASKYDFLLVNNMTEKKWFLYHTRGRAIVTVDNKLLIKKFDKIDGLIENEIVSMETVVYIYENVIEWICTTLSADSSVLLPCTINQIHCVRQFNLVISIKRSYKALYGMCEEKLIHLFQSTYAKLLYKVLQSNSSLSLKSLQECLQNVHKFFVMPINISWLDGNTARRSQQATNKLESAIENFNKEYTLKGLLAVINAFLYYDASCCASAKIEYSDFLCKERVLSAFKAFVTQIKNTLELLSAESIEIPDQDFEYSTIQEILQRVYVAIPNNEQAKFQEYEAAESLLNSIVMLSQSSIVSRFFYPALNTLTTKMQHLWNLTIPSQETFKPKCNIFCINPSMKRLPEVIRSYSELRPFLSDYKDDLEYLLKYAFDQIHACLVDIKQKEIQSSITSDLEISVTELESLYQGIEAIPEAVTQAPALAFLFKKLHALVLKSQEAKIDTEEQLLDPATLLITVPKMIHEMLAYYRELCYLHREKERQALLKWLPIDAERIRVITATLLHHPMACSTVTLMSWDRFMKDKLLSIVALKPPLYIEKKDEDDINIYQGLVTLFSEVKKCSKSLSSLVELRQNLDLAVFVVDLNMYTYLCSESDQARAITQNCLGLHESFIKAGYLEHFSEWLRPGLLGLSSDELTVNMKRLSPQQELLVLVKEPNEVPENTIVLLATEDNGWKTYYKDTTENCFKCCSIAPKAINDILAVLGKDAHQRVTDGEEVELTIEKKAKLLETITFGDSKEFSVTCNINFCNQTILNEICSTEVFLIEINLLSNKILFKRLTYREYYTYNNQFIYIIFCHSSQLENLRLPYLQDEQKQLYSQREAFLCIVRHPSQPAIIKSVTNCGDQVTLNFCYSTPLATTHLPVTSSTFIEQVRPILSLLNRYQDLYQTYLPIDTLREKLADSLKHCCKPLFEKEITGLVKSIQKKFIKSLLHFASTIDDDNLNIILKVKEEILESENKNVFIKGLLLTGLELFLCFILVQKAGLVDNTIQQDTDIHRFHQYWLYICKEMSLSKSETECLLTAFAYIRESQTVDKDLSQESAAVRSQAYTMIIEGLQLFKLQVHRDAFLEALTKQLCGKASHFMEIVKIEILWDCSKKVKKDDRNLPSLFSIIHSLEPLAMEVMRLPSLCAVEANEKDCFQCLESSSSIFVDITDIVLFWCTNQIHYFFQKFQLVLSQGFLTPDHQGNEIETGVHTFTSWVMSGLEEAFSRNDWESIHQHIRIVGILAMEVHDLVQDREYPNAILCLSTVIRVIRMSENLADASYILENVPCDQWLKYLIVSNFLYILQSYYLTTIDDNLRDQLVHLETKLLQIFYNVFVNDQYNHKSSHENLAGFVSLKQISTISSWLGQIKPVSNVCTVLCRTSLALWKEELIEIYFKQYIEHWTDITEADKQKTVYLLKRVHLNTGINHSDFIALLCTVRRKYIESASYNSVGFLELFEDLYYGKMSLEQVTAIVFSHEYNQWKKQLEATKCKKREKCESRTLSDVLDLLEIQVKSGDYDIATEQFEVIKREAHDIVSLIYQKLDAVTISQLDEEFLCLLKRYVSEEKIKLLDKDHRVKFVTHIVIVWILCTSEAGQKQAPYNTQIVSLLLFLHANDKGLLQQVKTGEGKTLIVAMLAAAKALLGYHVDIVFSNRDLAQDGMRKCQPFFKHLGLQAAVNCTEDDDTNQQAYKSHIVYGDVGSFQRDVLTEECKPGGTNFAARYADLSRNCLIVDEVDSMFLDKGQHMLYLSHETPELKHLETLFIMIWSAVLSISQDNDLTVDQITYQLTHKLGILIDTGIITIPNYLKDFCKKKLRSWVRSACNARFMDVDDQFIIDSRNSHVKQIFPIDKQTGIEQYNMKWTDGLSQFLELKYRRPLSTQSLRAVFISNKRFFKRYGKQLFGLTGTLGSESSRSLLEQVYSIKAVEIPTNRPKRYIQTKSRVATNSKMWCEQVKMEVLDIIKEQPVLVICNNIKQLNSVKQYLKADSRFEIVESGDDRPSSGTKLRIEIIDCARDGDDVEKRFDKQGGALHHQLILATNKGGRGTDIKIKEAQSPKGLHVIVSFLPENTRIEEQAFGQAARAGQAGSGCLIIQIDPLKYEETLATFNTLEASTETLIEMEKIKRKKGETEYLTLFLKEEIPKLDLEEQLYASFQHNKKALVSLLDSVVLFKVCLRGTKHVKQACQKIVTNQWVFWLESVQDQIRSADTPDKRQAILEMFNKEFVSDTLLALFTDYDSTFFKEQPENYIHLGQAYLKEKQYLVMQRTPDENTIKSMYRAALTCFERAYNYGDKTGFAAMAACYCFVQLNPKASKNNKKKVRRYLKLARSQLITLKQSWMGNVEMSKALTDLVDVSQLTHESENHYALQIEGKLKVIGLHLHIIETLLGRPLEESSFVKGPVLNLQAGMISEEQSKELYQCLCKNGIICHHKVRKCWKEREKIEPLIKKNVEATIAEDLIKLILKKSHIEENDLKSLVYSSEELWDLLRPLMEPTQMVTIIKVEQIDEKVSGGELAQSWATFRTNIEFCGPSFAVLLSDDPVYSRFQSEKYSKLKSHLKTNGLCIDTRQGKLKNDASKFIETIHLGKFVGCKIYTENGEEQNLLEFLAGLISYCFELEGGYLYEYMLPYGTESVEAKKLHIFLQEQDILKSGELVCHKYDSNDDELESSVKKAIGKEFTKKQTAFIFSILRGLKGEVRAFERDLQIEFVSFYDLNGHPEDIEELNFFATWHMDHFLSLQHKDEGCWDWNAFACAMLGVAQVATGVALVTLTATSQVCNALIADGMNDMVYATMAGLTGTFSWKDYAIQKAISIAIVVASGGLDTLATTLQAATRVGAATRFSAFTKIASKTVSTFALNVSTSILPDVVLADVQECVVETIVDSIEKHLFLELRDKIRKKLIQLSKVARSDREFYSMSGSVIEGLRSQFGHDRSEVTALFEHLQSQLVSLLAQKCHGIAGDLFNSSKWAKLGRAGAKVAFFASKILEMININIRTKVASTTTKLFNLLRIDEAPGSELCGEDSIDMSIIDFQLKIIESCFKEFIHRQLRKKIRSALYIVISKTMKMVAIATKNLAQASVQKAFNSKSTSQLVRDNMIRTEHSTMMREVINETCETSDWKQELFLKKRDDFQHIIVQPKQVQHSAVFSSTSIRPAEAQDENLRTPTPLATKHLPNQQCSEGPPRVTKRHPYKVPSPTWCALREYSNLHCT